MEKLGLGVIDPDDQESTTEQDPQVRGGLRGEMRKGECWREGGKEEGRRGKGWGEEGGELSAYERKNMWERRGGGAVLVFTAIPPLQARKNASIQKAIEYLIHASQCRNPLCKIPSCIRMKRILRHTRDCRLRTTGNCHICKQFLFLVYSHAKNCKETNCPVGVICKRVKHNIQDTRAQQRRRNNLLLQQRMLSMQRMTSGNGNSQAVGGTGSPAHTSPSTSKVPPTPPQKESPATHAPSPAGPRSVGKGGPRTPAGEISGGKGGKQKMVVSSPAVSKPEWPMPAPNVTVNPVPMGEEIIQRVPQPQPMATPTTGQREQEIMSKCLSSNPQEKEQAKQLLQQDPELARRVQALWRTHQMQQQQAKEMGAPPDIAPHQPQPMAAFTASRQVPNMMNVRSPQAGLSGYPPGHPQLMRAMPAQLQTYSPVGQVSSYRPASYHHQTMHPMMSQGQVYQQQQPHHGSQLSRMLTQRQPVQQYQSPPTAYSQMPAPTHPVGPPPQYSMRMPPQPQTAGYPHMLGHPSQQMSAHNAMKQHVGPTMQAGPAHQFGSVHQSMQMDPRMSADGSFVQSYSLNNSNNNNTLSQGMMYLTPENRQETLSRITDLL